MATQRFQCVCAYDGTGLGGWQSQPGGNTVQDILEKRLHTIFKQPVRIQGSGRTDAGVHARAQVFHFDAIWEHETHKLARALLSGMPESIQVTRIKKAPKGFHARFSATGKRYLYNLHMQRANPMQTRFIWSLGRTLNIDAMQEAANILLGTHDFRNFSARRNDGSDEQLNPVKTLRTLSIKHTGKRVRICAEGDGFLYKMVRSLVGALVECGLEKLTLKDLAALLDAEPVQKRPYQTAPAQGLCLDKVFYR